MADGILPETEGEWKRFARKYKVENQSLWMNPTLYSAFQVTYKQYLLFRTVLPRPPLFVHPRRLNTQALGIAPLIAQADLLLSDVAFRDYILDVTTRLMQPI